MATRTGKKGKRELPDPSRPFHSLNAAEKEAVWESFNDPAAEAGARPLTPAERRRYEAVRARGRPATRRVMVGLDEHLLAEADNYAERNGLARAQLFAVGLRLAMAAGVTAQSIDA